MSKSIELANPRWKKTLLESLTIVFSILFAFMIDAWWGNQVEQNEVNESLLALADDFQQVVEELDIVSTYHTNRVSSALFLMSVTPENIGSFHPDTLEYYLQGTKNLSTFDGQIATLESMVSFGLLPKVNNQKLRNDIAAWERSMRDYQTSEDIVRRVMYDHYMPWLTGELVWKVPRDSLYTLFNDVPQIYLRDYSALYPNYQFTNYLQWVASWSQVAKTEAIGLRQLALGIVTGIRSELDRTP